MPEVLQKWIPGGIDFIPYTKVFSKDSTSTRMQTLKVKESQKVKRKETLMVKNHEKKSGHNAVLGVPDTLDN